VKILLNSLKNVASVNVDNYEKIQLSNKLSLINEYDIRNILSATEIFDSEREASEIYRIYGKIDYISLLNGLKNNYTQFSDFFYPQFSGNSKNILNSFDFYLVKPASSGYTQILSGGSTILWTRYFQVIATPNEFEIFPAGFSNNVYGEQAYAFTFNKDFDVSPYLDQFGFPLTELFLYAQYKPTANGLNAPEMLSGTVWSASGISSSFAFAPIALNIGDYVESFFGAKIGDLIEYSNIDFLQVQLLPQTFYIQTPYKDISGNSKNLIWKYNPFISFPLRYFADELNQVNTGSTSYDQTIAIPYYATPIDIYGNFVWRDILSQGYTDPTTNLGVNYPFMNKKRYLFSNFVLDITPDLNDTDTLAAFAEVWYSRYATKITTVPITDISNIGKPCL
jgi:hypothetical protein